MNKSKRLLPRFHRYMVNDDRKMHQKGTGLCILSGILIGLALGIMMPAAMALQTMNPQWGLSFRDWVIVLASVALLASVFSFWGTKLSYAAGLGFMKNVQKIVGNKVARLPLGWFQADSAGRLSRMVTQEMLSTGQTAAFFIGQLVKNVSAVIVFCIAIWFWNWQLGILLTLAIPVLFLLMKISQVCVGKGNSLEDAAEQEIASRVVEFYHCQGALRACHTGADYEELKSSFVNSKRQSVRGLWWSALGQVLSGMGVQMLVAGMITFISLLGVAGDIEALETVVMIGVTLRFTTLLNDIASSLFGMEDRRQMLNSLDEVMGAPEMSVVAKTKGQPKNADITLNCVSFSYTKDKPVIQDISFTVPAHKMFAVVGPSGCGKTTIIKLIARFYDVDEGTIHIGNIALRDYTTEDLFRQISFVFQDVYLFNDSLKNNILIAKPDATDQELHAVADLAGVTEIVQRLPDGWDTICGEGGRSLSGGERQRVSIARALLKHAPIVLLDEATSALDAENEANIVRSIEVLRKNSTLVVVAHKLETIRMADEIIVLDQAGRITEAGSHEELLKQNGPYKEFWAKRSASAQWKLA
ncbi:MULTISPECIES: ABC transporter ATP-binding protein [Pseudoflavonifractor]|nr:MULTISPECIES: ABC transporter ATP-binding protein [Pseudoflavonifractor]MBM6927200.1 ABC transporter ATP-binding protein [Pseudoflavonifractor phocaeensis]